MTEQNFPDNIIYELDNLDVLRGMNSETVDLIATDPPFNTKRNRSGTAGFYVDNWRWGDTGQLPDQWAWNEVHPVWLEEVRDENRALFEVIEAADHCHGDDIAAFLCFLSVRLLEMHRILKPTGSLYLHCDHTANAYIRMALDAIFGARNFRNEIVWRRYGSHNDATTKWGRVHDTIFFYTKSSEHTWTGEIRQPYDPKYLEKAYRNSDMRGRYTTAPLHARGLSGGGYNYTWRGIEDTWRFPQQRLEEMESAGELHWPPNGTIPRRKVYMDEQRGLPATDIILDIDMASKNERTGSPDQKPLALYERIILASSNPSDLVLDPFAGCATTIMAARQHRRRWVGIDRRKDARFHVVCRMMGIKARDAEEMRERPDLADWINAQLAKHESHFSTTPPVRTNEGNTAAPYPAPVYLPKERPVLNHRQMKDFLLETFGLRCWGCDFTAPDERYLQLDHADPKRDGGSNDLDNRTLLCQPCNLAKSDRITLGQLRRENIRASHLTKSPGLKRGEDGHPIDLQEARQHCRAALEHHRDRQSNANIELEKY